MCNLMTHGRAYRWQGAGPVRDAQNRELSGMLCPHVLPSCHTADEATREPSKKGTRADDITAKAATRE